ncbi:MAG: hypothetical protein V4664_04250 [Patescibacteria group bacterium]
MLFFKNIDYLRKKRGLTIKQVVEGCSDSEYRVNRHAINKYKRGEFWSARIRYLLRFSEFFGESLPRLLSDDIEASEEAIDVRGVGS